MVTATTETMTTPVVSNEKQQMKYDFDQATESYYIGESDRVTFYAGRVNTVNIGVLYFVYIRKIKVFFLFE